MKLKLTRKRWIGIGIAIFLAAFGTALAITFHQVSREIPTTLTVSGVVVLPVATWRCGMTKRR